MRCSPSSHRKGYSRRVPQCQLDGLAVESDFCYVVFKNGWKESGRSDGVGQRAVTSRRTAKRCSYALTWFLICAESLTFSLMGGSVTRIELLTVVSPLLNEELTYSLGKSPIAKTHLVASRGVARGSKSACMHTVGSWRAEGAPCAEPRRSSAVVRLLFCLGQR